jgi:4-hydroxy-tetrahydrodipicolinate synthase
MTSLSGVWAASLTPLDEELRPDVGRLCSHIGRLLTDGCHGVVLFGTTGEATSFSSEERRRLLDELIRAGVDPGRLIVGVGCAAMPDTVELAGHAGGRGVAAVLMLPPFYYKDVSDDGLADAYGWMLNHLPGLPVLLYNFPRVAGVRISAELGGRLMTDCPGQVVGVKDSSGDLDSLRGFLAAMPGAAVFAGTELLLESGLAEGAVGTISAMANVNADQIRKVYEARSGTAVLRDARVLTTAHPLIPALKAITAARLADPGWRRVRPPLRALSVDEGAALAAALPST